MNTKEFCNRVIDISNDLKRFIEDMEVEGLTLEPLEVTEDPYIVEAHKSLKEIIKNASQLTRKEEKWPCNTCGEPLGNTNNVFVSADRIKKKLIAAKKRLNESHLKEIRTRLKEIIDEEEKESKQEMAEKGNKIYDDLMDDVLQQLPSMSRDDMEEILNEAIDKATKKKASEE